RYRSRPMAGRSSARGTSTFTRPNPGCTCRSKRRTKCTPIRWRAAGSTRRSPSAPKHWPNRKISGPDRRTAPFTSTRTAAFWYGANRAEATAELQGKQVFKGGENSIVVYAINQSTGEPSPIQHIETQKIHPRTFHIDPSGRLLVAEHNAPLAVRDGDAIRTVPAGLSVFRIGDDGKLTFARKYDVDVGDKTMFWMGMVAL